MAPELGAGTRGARADDPSPAFDPWVTGGSGETNPDTRARRLVSSEADAMTGLQSKASRARARRQWRTAAAAFRQWRQRGRVAAGARRTLATVGKHRAFDRTTAVAAIASWRCLTTLQRRARNDADAARVAVHADAVSLRERAVDATVEKLVAGRLRDAARVVEAARASEEENKRRAHMRVRAAELERDAHCEDAERECRRADAAEAEGVAMCRRVAESLAEEAKRAASVAAADAAAEREWLRVALEKAWAEVLTRRRAAGARDADASLHEHLASVAGEAWAEELAKALEPPAEHVAAPMLAPERAPPNGAARIERMKERKRATKKVPVSRGLNPPALRGRVVGVARRDFAPRVSTPPNGETRMEGQASRRFVSANPAWRAPSLADPSPLAAEELRDREAARERALLRREGRFGNRGHSTRAKSSPWTPKSLSVSSRAASLLSMETSEVSTGLVESAPFPKTLLSNVETDAATSLVRTLRLPSESASREKQDSRLVFSGAASPVRATLAKKERLNDEAWETSRVRFALSREAFRAAVDQRLISSNHEPHDDCDGEKGAAEKDALLASPAPYSVQTPDGESGTPRGTTKLSRLGVVSAEGGALALAAAAARRFALPGDTDTDESDGASDSDEHEWLFREKATGSPLS